MLKKFYIEKLYYNLNNVTLIHTLSHVLITTAQLDILNTEEADHH
jgi:hypothetical protein